MKYQKILNLAQRYDKAIEHLEKSAIARLNKSFDDACRQLLIPRVGEDEADFLKDYPKYEVENPGVARFEKTAGFSKVKAIKDLIAPQYPHHSEGS